MSWLPWIDDDNVSDPRYDPSWSYLYDDFVDNVFWENTTYKQLAFFLSSMPFVGDIGVMADSYRSFQDYMKNNNLTWNDIMYPWLAGRKFGVSSSGFGALNYVSSNIRQLYR